VSDVSTLRAQRHEPLAAGARGAIVEALAELLLEALDDGERDIVETDHEREERPA
jgi:hypothetical protein